MHRYVIAKTKFLENCFYETLIYLDQEKSHFSTKSVSRVQKISAEKEFDFCAPLGSLRRNARKVFRVLHIHSSVRRANIPLLFAEFF